MEQNGNDTAVDQCLARAVVSRALALGLRPPGESSLPGLNADANREALRQAAGSLDGEQSRDLAMAVEDLLALEPDESHDLSAQYQTLFGHTLRGAVCPYEAEYGPSAILQQAQELADLAGFYHAFGLQIVAQDGERPDHVVCELEFLGFLARKEAHALVANDDEMASVTSAAGRRFLAEHVGRFGRAFAHLLEEAAECGFYASLARLCAAFLAAECKRQGIPLGAETLELRTWDPNDAPMACGGAPQSDLVQLRDSGTETPCGGQQCQ